MRGTPRTSIDLRVPSLRNDWVEFPIPTEIDPTDRHVIEAADAYWRSLDLSGAIVLVHPQWHVRPILELRLCRDLLLNINVHLRRRGGLLHTDFPLLDELPAPTDTKFATDDPRLVALVPHLTKED